MYLVTFLPQNSSASIHFVYISSYTARIKKCSSNLYVPHNLKVSVNYDKTLVKPQCAARTFTNVHQQTYPQHKEKLCLLRNKQGIKNRRHVQCIHLDSVVKVQENFATMLWKKTLLNLIRFYSISFTLLFIALVWPLPQRTSVLHSFQTHQSSTDTLLAGSH